MSSAIALIFVVVAAVLVVRAFKIVPQQHARKHSLKEVPLDGPTRDGRRRSESGPPDPGCRGPTTAVGKRARSGPWRRGPSRATRTLWTGLAPVRASPGCLSKLKCQMPSVARSFTTIAVAKRLGVSLQTVQRWVDAGHLRAWKTPGGHRRIEAASAEALFKAHEEGVGLAPVAGAAAAIHAPSVVIVEDDPAAATLLETLVHKALPQARVVVAENGFQGLIVIGRLSPQVVITDISMPYMNGHQLMHSLMAEPGMRPRLLIAVTALTPDELAAQGSLPQGVRLFSKPVPRDPFVAELRKVA